MYNMATISACHLLAYKIVLKAELPELCTLIVCCNLLTSPSLPNRIQGWIILFGIPILFYVVIRTGNNKMVLKAELPEGKSYVHLSCVL